MGNFIPGRNDPPTDKSYIDVLPNHLLIDVMGNLNESDISSFNFVCRRWHWLVSVTPPDRLPKLHVSRIVVECGLDGRDSITYREQFHPTKSMTASADSGPTKFAPLSKLRRLSCEELRLSGLSLKDASSWSSRQRNDYDGKPIAQGYAAVDPLWLTTVVECNLQNLTKIYIIRCNLFRFTEKDLQQLALLDNLTLLCIFRVTEANAVNDESLVPVARRGKLEKVVLDDAIITDVLLEEMATHCRNLMLLSVWGCDGVSATGVAALSRKCQKFKIICRETGFKCSQFLQLEPTFVISSTGRALEDVHRHISVHFS